MRKITTLVILFSSLAVFAEEKDNIDCSIDVEYRLKSSNGRLASVKIIETERYAAIRTDDETVATTFYGNGIKLDKATSPDVKPVYRPWESSDIFYSGSRICYLPLKLPKGKSVKVEFERTMTEPEQFTNILIAPSSSRIAHVNYRIQVPADIASALTFTPVNFPDGMEMKTEKDSKGNVTYSVSADDYVAYKNEKMRPEAIQLVPRIEVTGFFHDTQSLYDFLHSKVEDNETSEAVKAQAEEICRGLDNDIERINAIATWVRRNIRYVAVVNGELGFRPDVAEEVLKKRFADCKGSANLIRTMLRSLGMDGRLVWIGTKGDVIGSWTDRPSLSAGNHMIAAAVLPDTTIFLDGTTTYSPAGLISSSIAGQECMILNGDKPLIARVPEADGSLNRIELKGTLTVVDNGLAGKYSVDYSGERRSAIESYLSSVSAPKRKAVLEILTSFGRKGVSADSLSVSTASDGAMVTTVSYVENDPSGVRKISGGKTYVLPRPLRTFGFGRVDATARKSPLDLGRLRNYDTSLTIAVPEGMMIEKVPDRIDIDTPWFKGYVVYTVADDGRTVDCRATLNMVKSDGDPGQVKEWNDAVKVIEAASSSPIILIKTL